MVKRTAQFKIYCSNMYLKVIKHQTIICTLCPLSTSIYKGPIYLLVVKFWTKNLTYQIRWCLALISQKLAKRSSKSMSFGALFPMPYFFSFLGEFCAVVFNKGSLIKYTRLWFFTCTFSNWNISRNSLKCTRMSVIS